MRAFDIVHPCGCIERVPADRWGADGGEGFVVYEFPDGDGFSEAWLFADDVVLEVEPVGKLRLHLGGTA